MRWVRRLRRGLGVKVAMFRTRCPWRRELARWQGWETTWMGCIDKQPADDPSSTRLLRQVLSEAIHVAKPGTHWQKPFGMPLDIPIPSCRDPWRPVKASIRLTTHLILRISLSRLGINNQLNAPHLEISFTTDSTHVQLVQPLPKFLELFPQALRSRNPTSGSYSTSTGLGSYSTSREKMKLYSTGTGKMNSFKICIKIGGLFPVFWSVLFRFRHFPPVSPFFCPQVAPLFGQNQ